MDPTYHTEPYPVVSELKAVLMRRLWTCFLIGGMCVFDIWEQRHNPSAAAVELAFGVGWVLSAMASLAWPNALYFLADALLCASISAYLLLLTLIGRNYWSRWAGLDYVLIVVAGALAVLCFRRYRRLTSTSGHLAGAVAAVVWCLAGWGVIAADWFRPEASAHIHRGNIHAEKREFPQAIAEFTKAIEITPTVPEGYYNRGLAYKQSGAPMEAVADFTAAIERRPDFALAYLQRGNCKHLIKDLNGAEADYTRAIELDPSEAEAYYLRGVTRLARGKRGEAAQDFESCWKLRPDLKEQRENAVKEAMRAD
jgi:tetratricopeptide (TPR) repeat protein